MQAGASGGIKSYSAHLWDGQNIVAETGLSGNLKARYLRGVGLLAQVIDGKCFYYLHNAHGDVVQRVSKGGDPTPLYRYDAFGNQREPVETDPNPFRYCGEYFDGETQSVYLRARYYDPKTSRMLSEDTLRYFSKTIHNGQAIIDPQSLNLYTYCYHNPIAYTDPSGHFLQKTAEVVKEAVKMIAATAGSFTVGVIEGIGEAVTASLSNNIAQGMNATAPPNPIAHAIGKILGNVGTGIGGAIVGASGAAGGAALVFATGGASAIAGGAVAVAGGAVAISGGAAAVKNTMALASSLGGSGGSSKITFLDSALKHIFRDAPGHFKVDTPENRQTLFDLVSNNDNFLGTDIRGNDWYGFTDSSGKQVWASVRGNEIRNGGINQTPKIFHPKTGLSSPVIPRK